MCKADECFAVGKVPSDAEVPQVVQLCQAATGLRAELHLVHQHVRQHIVCKVKASQAGPQWRQRLKEAPCVLHQSAHCSKAQMLQRRQLRKRWPGRLQVLRNLHCALLHNQSRAQLPARRQHHAKRLRHAGRAQAQRQPQVAQRR